MTAGWPWPPGTIGACAEFSPLSPLERPLITVELHPLELQTLIGALEAMAVRATDRCSPVGKIAEVQSSNVSPSCGRRADDSPHPERHPTVSSGRSPRWLLWREIQRKGKRTKAPFTVRNTAASSTNANSWAPFSEIKAVILKRPRLFDGVGFSLGDLGTGDHVAGIDLDSCLDEDGAVADWAPPIVDALNTYIEVSPSETGLKALF